MPYQSVTLAEMRERLRDKWEGKPYWDREEARLAINEALSAFNLCTGKWCQRETIQTVSTLANIYTASSAMLYRARVTFLGRPLQPSSVDDLAYGRRTWRTESTTTGGDVPTRPVVWAPISLKSFYLWPADAGAPNALVVDGVAATPVLVEDGDFLDLGDELLNVILGYALHAAAFKKGGTFFSATQPYYQAFLAAAAEENSQIKTSTVYRRVMGQDFRGLLPLTGTPTLLDTKVSA